MCSHVLAKVLILEEREDKKCIKIIYLDHSTVLCIANVLQYTNSNNMFFKNSANNFSLCSTCHWDLVTTPILLNEG